MKYRPSRSYLKTLLALSVFLETCAISLISLKSIQMQKYVSTKLKLDIFLLNESEFKCQLVAIDAKKFAR